MAVEELIFEEAQHSDVKRLEMAIFLVIDYVWLRTESFFAELQHVVNEMPAGLVALASHGEVSRRFAGVSVSQRLSVV